MTLKIFIAHAKASRIKLSSETPVLLENLSDIEDASCTSLDMNNVLDYMEPDKRILGIELAIRKLRINGTVKFEGIDVDAFCLFVMNDQIPLGQINSILYNGQGSIGRVGDLVNMLKSHGLFIENVKVDGVKYEITGRRNG